MTHQYFLERARDRMLAPVLPYSYKQFNSTPQNEKMAVDIFNRQFMKMYYYAPELRARWRYLEQAEAVQTPFGRITVQAGAIVPKLWADMRSKMNGAMGAVKMHGKTGGIDAMVSLRPTVRSSGQRTAKTGHARYVTMKLGPPKMRKEVTLPYGWIVYILRHPTLSPVFPVSYEPIVPLMVSIEELGEHFEVFQDKIDEYSDHIRAGEIIDAATEKFNEAFAQGENPQSVTVALDGSGVTEVEVFENFYNTWFPKNIRLEVTQPTWKYEMDFEEYEAYLVSKTLAHYPNDFNAEIDHFNLGNV